MNHQLSLIFYGIVWCFIIILIVINCKSLRYLNQRVKLLEEEECNSETGDPIQKEETQQKESLLAKQINSVMTRIQYYPIVTTVVWFFLSLDRVTDDILMLVSRDKVTISIYENEFLLYLKLTSIGMHNIV